ncbi:MAG TPA: IPT/TIG domain-containing protein [Thermoanaerobaculia bacterium]
MIRTSLRSCLTIVLLCAGAAHAQQAAHVSPASAPVTGGTQVTINGSGFTPDMTVTFGGLGGVSAESRFVDSNTIIAVAPSHLPGPSTVTVFDRFFFRFAEAPFLFVGAPEDAFEPMMLPIYTSALGRFGAVFSSFLTAFNTSSDQTIRMYGTGGFCDNFFFGPVDLLNTSHDIPPAHDDNGCGFQTGNPGVILWVQKELASSFVANLRVADLSRSFANFGTEIPVVRKADFRNGAIALAGIPLTPQFRLTLRIYSLEQESTTVTVRWIQGGSETVDLRPAAGIFHPAYAQVSQFPGFVASPVPERADLLIEPSDPSRRIWAFVSVTNNETQDITVIAP